jgi:hypothetical protein
MHAGVGHPPDGGTRTQIALICISRIAAATHRDLRQNGGDARLAESDADHTAE